MVNKAIALLAVAMAAAGCARDAGDGSFLVEGRIAGGDGRPRTAYLYELLPEYQKLTVADSSRVVDGRFRFSGGVPGAREAFVKIEGDSATYPIVLTNNHLTMHISTDGLYLVYGSPGSELLSGLSLKRQEAEEEMMRVQVEYMRMAADSTLTRAKEDSLLARYGAALAGFRSEVVGAVAANAESRPVTSRVLLRAFESSLTRGQSDSLRSLLKIQR